MAQYPCRQMDRGYNFNGVQDRVYSKTTHQAVGKDYTPTLKHGTKRSSNHGGTGSVRKKSDIQNKPSIPGRLLVNVLPGSQENGRLETNPEFKTSERVHKAKTFQDGLPVRGPKGTHQGPMGHFNRLEGCLPAYTDPRRSSKMAPVLYQRPGLCLQVSPVWAINSPTGIYPSSQVYRGIPSSTGSPDPSIFGRLAHNFNNSGSNSSSHRLGAQNSLQTRLCSELKEVTHPAVSDSCFLGSQVRSCPRESFPYSRKSVEPDCLREIIQTNRLSPSGSLAETLGFDGKHGRSDSTMQTPNETNTITPVISLSTKDTSFGETGTRIRDSQSRAQLVGVGRQYPGRNDISDPPSSTYANDRRKSLGLRSSFGTTEGQRSVEPRSKASTYQCIRTAGSGFITEATGQTNESVGQKNSSKDGQHHRSVIHQQARGHEIPNFMLVHETTHSVVRQPGDTVDCGSYTRGRKHPSRQSITGGVSESNRVVTTTPDCSRDFSQNEPISINGPVCDFPKQTNTSFLFKKSGRSSICNRRSVNVMESNDSVRLSPNFSYLQSNRENFQGGLRDHSDNTILAKSAMVSDTFVDVNRSPIETSGQVRLAKDCGKAQTSISQCRTSKTDCLEIIKKQYKEAGFSEKTADLAARGRRETTLAVYSSRLRCYFNWCSDKQIDPYHASIAEIADFLESLFSRGLQTSTIKGYKSAVSSVHKGLPDGTKLNDDPNRSIHFLIEGMNNKRPPVRKIMPEWDLGTVLKHLNGSPYEPLQSADIRDLTVKTVFLVTIASGRRCSEIHALTSGDHVVFSKRGVTLHVSADFLAKNETSSFSMSPLFIPYLDPSSKKDRKERLSCPVRALRWYLDRTQTARTISKSTKLFITCRKPFRSAAKATIAGWIVSAIAGAGEVDKLKPTAHSTRATASSWAFSHGLSISEITNTISWRSETTFVTTYLRDVGPCCTKAKFAQSVLRASSHKQ